MKAGKKMRSRYLLRPLHGGGEGDLDCYRDGLQNVGYRVALMLPQEVSLFRIRLVTCFHGFGLFDELEQRRLAGVAPDDTPKGVVAQAVSRAQPRVSRVQIERLVGLQALQPRNGGRVQLPRPLHFLQE